MCSGHALLPKLCKHLENTSIDHIATKYHIRYEKQHKKKTTSVRTRQSDLQLSICMKQYGSENCNAKEESIREGKEVVALGEGEKGEVKGGKSP